MRTLTLPGPPRGFPARGAALPRSISRPAPGSRTRPTLRRVPWRLALHLFLFSFLSIVVLAGVGIAAWTAHALRGLNRDFQALLTYRPGQATLIYAADGSLLARAAKEDRIYVPLSRIPRSLRNATVAAEDRRFWDHPGIDFRGIGRAFWRDVRSGRPSEGGSTLTMQLVRGIQLSPDKTLERKVREAALALRLEQVYSKPKLLEMYLNQVFYGSGAYGVAAAARAYFSRPVETLTPAQCALLATLPRRPTGYNPFRDPSGARARRDHLLRTMAAQSYLTPAQLNRALKEPLGVRSGAPGRGRAPYFVDAVVERLTDLYGADAVYRRGLRVYTTLNPALQAAAEESVRRGVRALRGRNVSQGALIALDPETGEVKALVGGVDYRRSSYDRALRARRQPGSAFKPFVYAAAMQQDGLSPLDRITDGPFALAADDGPAWKPKDYTGRFAGQTTLANAFAQSMNIPAVKLAMHTGVDQVAGVARACGIRSPLREVPSLALGTSEVTPLELTAAYVAFATQGRWSPPVLIRKVDDADGQLLDRFGGPARQVLDPLTARKVDYLLRGVVEGGTGRSVRSIPRARGKTGTTQDDRDAWFVGYTPEIAAGVWVGNDTPATMWNVWGGNGCAPIWRSFMEIALRVLPHRPDPPAYIPSRAVPRPPVSEIHVAAAGSPQEPDAPEWYTRTVDALDSSHDGSQDALMEGPPDGTTGSDSTADRDVSVAYESGDGDGGDPHPAGIGNVPAADGNAVSPTAYQH